NCPRRSRRSSRGSTSRRRPSMRSPSSTVSKRSPSATSEPSAARAGASRSGPPAVGRGRSTELAVLGIRVAPPGRAFTPAMYTAKDGGSCGSAAGGGGGGGAGAGASGSSEGGAPFFGSFEKGRKKASPAAADFFRATFAFFFMGEKLARQARDGKSNGLD